MAVGIKTNTDSETLDISPGGLFTHPDQVTSIDLTSVEGHLDDAIEAARAAKGWAVGDDSLPLTGYTDTNNARSYANQASSSANDAASAASNAANSVIQANAARDAAQVAEGNARSAATRAETAATRAETAETNAETAQGLAEAARDRAISADSDAQEARRQAQAAAIETDSDARKTDSDVRTILPIVQEVRDLREAVRQDSEEIAALRVEIDSDARAIDSDVRAAETLLAEIDSEAQVAEAYAVGTGPLAGEGQSRDSDEGEAILTSADFFGVGSTNFVEITFPQIPGVTYGTSSIAVNGGTRNVLQVQEAFANNREVRVYLNYIDQGAKVASQFDGGINTTYNAINVNQFTTPPAAGDRVHVFITEQGHVPNYMSAWWQAQRAEWFSDEARRFDSDAQQRDSEITSLVNGANARIDSEKIVRRDADIALQAEIDSDVAALRGDIRTIIDSDIRHIHARINEVVVVGYGLDYIEADSDIIVDSDIIASRRYVNSEIADLIGASPGIYTTLTRIREALDSDETVLDSLVAYMDSDRVAREELADRLQANFDSDVREITRLGARIDSDNTALRADVDSDAQEIRELGLRDSELQVAIDNRKTRDTELQTAIDQLRTDLTSDIDSDEFAIDRIDSELGTIRSRLDSESGTATSFRGLTDTPNSYSGDAGEFPRVTAAENGLEFFNPFPVTNNRLTSLNGLRIRRFDADAIVFATFEPQNLTLRASPSSLAWDTPVTGFTFSGDNDSLVPETFLTRITNYQVGGNARTIATDYNSFANSRTWTDGTGYIDSDTWTNNAAVSFPVSGTFRNSDSEDQANRSITVTWPAASWSVSGSWGNLRFDETVASVTIRATHTGSTSNVSSVTLNGVTPTLNGNTYSADSDGPFYFDTPAFTAPVSGTFTKPATVNNNSSRASSVNGSGSIDHGTIYFPTFLTTTAALQGLDASGYDGADSRSERDSSTTAWRSRRYELVNPSLTDSQTHYIWAPSTASSFTDPDSLGAPIAGVVHTQQTIGHTDHTTTYQRYAFTVAANSTQRVDIVA